MKKYNEEYFSVIEIKTGRKIVDCGDEMDAHTMVSFDPQNRTITKNKFLMGIRRFFDILYQLFIKFR